LREEFRHVSHAHPQVFLVEMSRAVLGMFSPASQQYAESALRQHGVQVRLGLTVTEVASDGVTLSDGSQIPTKTVIWAAGLKASTLPTQPPLSLLPSGRIAVEKDLSIRDFSGVYAIGDVANAADNAGKTLPQLAAVAKQAGQQCARNILASISGSAAKSFPVLRPGHPRDDRPEFRGGRTWQRSS